MTVYVVYFENGIEHEDCLSIWVDAQAAQAEAARLNGNHCQPWHKGCQARGTRCVGTDYRVRPFQIRHSADS